MKSIRKNDVIASGDNFIEARELHRSVIKRFPKRRIITLGIDDLWAADLMIMTKYKSENTSYGYILNVIDTFSKYVWSEPLKTKSGFEVANGFKTILKRAQSVGHKPPNHLHTDKGREFLNKDFKEVLSKNAIHMYHTENEEKSAIIERFNRTLNNKLRIQFEINQNFKWLPFLQKLIHNYNNHKHSTIKMKPVNVTKEDEPYLISLYSAHNQGKGSKPKLNVGDRVRITRKKEVFENKYGRNWTKEVFTIVRVANTIPVTYRIEDDHGEEIIGSFYEKELQKTKF